MLSSFKKSPVEQETIGCYSIFQVGSLSYILIENPVFGLAICVFTPSFIVRRLGKLLFHRHTDNRRVPQGTCGLKSQGIKLCSSYLRRVPQGTCGLKLLTCHFCHTRKKSGPARDLWIEILRFQSIHQTVSQSGPARDLWIEMLRLP